MSIYSPELFENLLEFQIGDLMIDLHNDCSFVTLFFNNSELTLVFAKENLKKEIRVIYKSSILV